MARVVVGVRGCALCVDEELASAHHVRCGLGFGAWLGCYLLLAVHAQSIFHIKHVHV